MKFFLLLPLFFSIITITHAAPQIWTSGFSMGFSEYNISTATNQHLQISCNTSAGDNYDHSVTFTYNNTEYQNTDSQYPLTFIFNDAIKISPPGTTKWRNGANAWNNFKNHIATATKIEVFVNHNKVATFIPSALSLRDVAKEMQGCDALW